jgi:phosphoribosylglycinamide formyltransferase-1
MLRRRGVEFICLAGYMRILTPWLVEQWRGKMINIHPALLPDFKGLHTHERALEAAVKEHGATVHWVTPGVDEGEIIAQARVPVFPDDTAEKLAARVLVEEHRLYPAAVRKVLGGQ